MIILNYFVEKNTISVKDVAVVSLDAGEVTKAKKFQTLIASVGVKDPS